MHRVPAMCMEACVALVILAPVFLVLDRRYVHNGNRTLCYLAFAFYLAAVDAVVGLPCVRYIRFDANINLKPFAYMFSDYQTSFLNVVLFVPLGVFLPVLWEAFRKFHWTVLFGFCLSLVIEVLQLFTFRATDVNDLMTNTAGTILGWCIARLLLWLVPGIRPQNNVKDVFLVCGITFAVLFFVQPFLADLAWSLLSY